MAVLKSVIQKIAAVVRVFGVSYVVVQTAIWHAFFAAHPWFLAGPLAAVAWGLTAAACLRRRRLPPPRPRTAFSPGRGAASTWSCWTWIWGTGPRPRATWR